MIVICENCHTNFKLSSRDLYVIKEDGRILKCGNCHHMWLAAKSVNPFSIGKITHSPTDKELIATLTQKHKPTLTLMDIVPDEPIENYFHVGHVPIFAKVLLFSTLFLSLFFSLILNKQHILENYSFLKPVMNVMGLKDTNGLKFEKIQISKISFKKDKPLIITGYIINDSDKKLEIPDIRIRFLDKENNILMSVSHNLPKKTLEPGEETRISNRLLDYPKEKTEKIIFDLGSYLEFLVR